MKRLSFNKALMILAVPVLAASLILTFGRTQVTQASPDTKTKVTNTQVDYFLKLDGIEGESTDNKHKGEIELLSTSWGKNRPGIEQEIINSGTGGNGAGKVSVQDVHFTMRTNKASPKLFLTSVSGKHIKSAILSVRKGGEDKQDYLVIRFSDLLISSYQLAGENPDQPIDQFSLDFARFEMEYKPQKADGTLDTPIKAGWDFKINKEI